MSSTPTHSQIVAQQQAELSAAIDDLALRRRAQQDAHEHHERLNRRLVRGDASVTADDLGRANLELERMATLVSAAERRRSLAQEQLGNADMQVPKLIAPAVQAVLGGVVNLAGRKPLTLPTTVGATPQAWIIQPKPSTPDLMTGRLNAEIVIGRVRGEHHRALGDRTERQGLPARDYLSDLEVALKAFNARLTTAKHGGSERIRVFEEPLAGGFIYEYTRPFGVSAYTEAPVINRVEKANWIGGALEQGVKPEFDEWRDLDSHIVSQSVDDQGIRRVVIEGDLHVQAMPGHARLNDPGNAVPRVSEIVQSASGLFADCVGRIESAQVVGAIVPVNLHIQGEHYNAQGARATVRIVAVSTDPNHAAENVDAALIR